VKEPSGKPSQYYDPDRAEMVSLLTERGIRDQRVLDAMGKVDRKIFVQEAFINRAYDDCALPIGQSQTISQPYTVAVMTECLEVKQGSRVLEVGTGSGYQAAVLAEMGARVFTIERHMSLLADARNRIEKAGYEVVSKCGDGTIGWKEFAPFDGIVVTAGAPEIPGPLLEQLSPKGGLLVIPIGTLDIQNLQVVRHSAERYLTREVVGFKFVPLIGKKGWKPQPK
jgi:protein-L-isoaspartate(D-aspartate) O-methyltransferase